MTQGNQNTASRLCTLDYRVLKLQNKLGRLMGQLLNMIFRFRLELAPYRVLVESIPP